MHPVQVEIFRRMKPAEKLEIVVDLWSGAHALKAAFLREQHPEWSDQQVESALRDWIVYART